MTTTQKAATIRNELKTFGINSRMVSVSVPHYGSIRVVIRVATVALSLVEAVANKHESIDRDQFGEILSGGNTFVWVSYSDEARDALAAPYLPAVLAAEGQIRDNSLITVKGAGEAKLGKGYNGYGISLWGRDGHLGEFDSPRAVAVKIGVLMLEAA